MPIEPGLIGEIKITVKDSDTAAAHPGKRLAPVLGTPNLVGLMEGAAHLALVEHLKESQSSVGVIVNIRHLAATPVGMEVRIRAELLETDGRRAKFKVEAWDEVEKIAECDHERFIIDWDRFIGRVEEKAKLLKKL